jgi:hypothetical protein
VVWRNVDDGLVKKMAVTLVLQMGVLHKDYSTDTISNSHLI